MLNGLCLLLCFDNNFNLFPSFIYSCEVTRVTAHSRLPHLLKYVQLKVPHLCHTVSVDYLVSKSYSGDLLSIAAMFENSWFS